MMPRPFSISPNITRAQPRSIIAFATATADPFSESSGRTRVTKAATFCGSRDERVRQMRADGIGLLKIGRALGIGTGVVQRLALLKSSAPQACIT